MPCDTYNSYLMADPNWQDQEEFQPNVACSFYLPPVEQCQWQLFLVKGFDPIECGDICQCGCEDSVHLEEVAIGGLEHTFCDLDRWCEDTRGPDNVQELLVSFRTGTTSGHAIHSQL